jgi:rsbT co-antagonist protein RsbR
VIVGISSRIAQTLVHLGVDLSTVVTRISMAKGLEYALARTGQRVIRTDTSRSPVVQAANDGWEV